MLTCVIVETGLAFGVNVGINAVTGPAFGVNVCIIVVTGPAFGVNVCIIVVTGPAFGVKVCVIVVTGPAFGEADQGVANAGGVLLQGECFTCSPCWSCHAHSRLVLLFSEISAALQCSTKKV